MKKYCFIKIFLGVHLLLFSSVRADLTARTQSGGTSDSYQPSLITDGGTITGFFDFSQGLALNATTTWAAEGRIATSLSCATYSLTLNNALHLGPTAAVSGSPSIRIFGNGNYIYLDGNNISFNSPWIVSTSGLVLDGLGHIFTRPVNKYFSYANAATFTLSNMTLVNTGSTSILNLFKPSNMTLRNVTIKNSSGLTGLLFDGSSQEFGITVVGNVRLEGPGSVFNFGGKVVIAANSSLYIGPDVTVSGLGVSDGVNPALGVIMTDSTSVLHLDGCKLYTGVKGLQIVKGTVLMGNKIRIFNCDIGSESSPNTSMNNSFILGDGTSAGDVNVRVLGGGYLEVIGCMDYLHS